MGNEQTVPAMAEDVEIKEEVQKLKKELKYIKKKIKKSQKLEEREEESRSERAVTNKNGAGPE